MSRPSLIVAGGGTGGHVLAGVAIADAWKAKYGAECGSIVFVGAQGGLEEKLVPRAGYPLRLLQLGSLKGAGLGKTLRTLFQLPLALLASGAIVLSLRPAAVIGVGGYASGPLVLMARLLGWLWGVRTGILEQNAVPGLTNRILGRICHRVMSAFPIEGRFGGVPVTVTGNPVRREIQPLHSAPREPFTIFIFGGSQGAQGINTLVLEALPHLKDLLPRLRFIHQTGDRDFERVQRGHQAAGSVAEVEKFVYDMPKAYSRASLLICRAGSGTLSEIAAVHRASVLVPFPYASDNHQEKNARIFVDAGAALLLTQAKARGEDLARIVRELVADPGRLAAMEAAASRFHRPDAAADVVRQLTAP